MINLVFIFGVLLNLNSIERFIQMPSGCAIEYKKTGKVIYGHTCDEVIEEIIRKRGVEVMV